MSTNNYYPRLYKITRSPNGYGFHLHGEKGKFGQIIRKIEPDSPAASCGLRLGDRVVAVNGKNVENCTHQQVTFYKIIYVLIFHRSRIKYIYLLIYKNF